jgi:pyruvate ferredoxin oxidoreductase alpha subunit
VLEKALAVGIGGIVSMDVHAALAPIDRAGGVQPHAYTVIAGLGGRPITKASLRALFTDAAADLLEPLTFLDLDHELVDREVARMSASRTSGPHAENMLRDLGTVAAGPV